ncbi:MAG TPA: hypothetical protein VF719_01155 [Abditibacteriaceae bacterium]
MKDTILRCRCGHQVLAKEVLRTDLYERSMGREYIYVKYRCRRCKRMGEAFVAESRWDWSILEPERNEMSDSERDQFLDEDVISTEEVLDFHRQLESVSDWKELQATVQSSLPAAEAARPAQTGENASSELPAPQDTTPATPEASLPIEPVNSTDTESQRAQTAPDENRDLPNNKPGPGRAPGHHGSGQSTEAAKPDDPNARA